jgi:hypothetical protein
MAGEPGAGALRGGVAVGGWGCAEERVFGAVFGPMRVSVCEAAFGSGSGTLSV